MAYIPGEWLVVCDRCGRQKLASACRKTWDNLFVCSDTCWEPRHPQDFVRNIPNIQRVPTPRPDVNTTQKTTTLASGASKDARSVVVSSAANISRYDSIGISLDGGNQVQWVLVDPAPSGTTIYINQPLWGAASSGNTVYLSYHDNTYSTTEQTATML